MQNNVPFRVIDKIEGGAFLEIRKALQVLRAQQPGVTPEQARLVEDPRGLAVVFEDRSTPPISVRQGAATPSSSDETRAIIAGAATPKPNRTVLGAHVSLIETAAIEFARKLPVNLEQYTISVAEEGPLVIVMFADRNALPNTRGGGARPGFEVAFDRKSMRVTRSNFVR